MKTRALFLAACLVVFSSAHAQFNTGGGTPPAKQDEPAVTLPVSQIVGTLEPRNLGPTTMGGRVTDIAVYEKEPRIFYVASASGGVWKTENGGVTFDPQFQNENTVSIGAIAVSQKNPDVVYVGTGEGTGRNSVSWGDGVYKSTDGGKTWVNVGLKETHHISRIIIDPKDDDTIYVGALGRLWGYNEERGLYKTTDAGKSWERVLYVDEKTGIADVEIDPKNPKVLIAATYHRLRRAWDFENGGFGSGLWRSENGGKTWTKITKGLPEGPVGRIGLDINRKDPKIMVATVEWRAPKAAGTEAEEEALESEEIGFDGGEPQGRASGTQDEKPDMTPRQGFYMSTDGGKSWEFKHPTNPRPFYFSIPTSDPSDPNRAYVPGVSIHYTEDAGKTFRIFRSSVHVDHHSMWINPNDSNHIIIGQDGGVGQTRDKGKTWEMLNGLPLGQYYAIGFDYRKPYHVYGGLQDNGCWGTPTQGNRLGGVAFYDTYFISGGDGFYTQSDPNDWRTIYTESQGGGVVRTNLETGEQRSIRPNIRGERLRFNWSAPIHLSPHNSNIVYVGANKLMKSVNQGNAWQAISPDLTTNNPEKQKVGQAAVTPDIDSGAERHCTIVTISESPMKAGLIWAGTDDGNVQVTQDGGATWANVAPNIPDLPPFLWCTRVTASKYVEGRCYVTFSGYKSNEFRPFVYVTEDFGKTWTNLGSGLRPDDPLHVIKEGDRNSELLYLGSEMGLSISVDRGKTWSKVAGGFPTVSVQDLAVHPRELDLVIGTHGRAIWLLDVVGLEGMTQENAKKDVHVMQPKNVYFTGFADNPGFQGDAVWKSNNTSGTKIHYYLKADAKEDVKVTISDASGTSSTELTGGKKAGLNSVNWNGRLRGRVQPGDYRVVVKVDGKEYTTSVTVEDVSGS